MTLAKRISCVFGDPRFCRSSEHRANNQEVIMRIKDVRRVRANALLLWSAFVFSGCGGSDSSSSGGNGNPPPQRGVTTCGTVSCQLGQYCWAPQASICRDGCLTDQNCAANQTCNTGAVNPTCVNVTASPTPPTPRPVPTGCKATCQKAFGCGKITATVYAGCNAQCDRATPTQSQMVADCGSVATCDNILSCLGG